ncbi:hypothetical protein Trydic_g13179 [Trypoxylus dichotomus]
MNSSNVPLKRRDSAKELGKVASGVKPRPLKVILKITDVVKLVLRCANKMRAYSTPGILISTNLTPRQVENKNGVLEKSRRLRSRAEEMPLKYIDGFPKTIESKNLRDPNSQQ